MYKKDKQITENIRHHKQTTLIPDSWRKNMYKERQTITYNISLHYKDFTTM